MLEAGIWWKLGHAHQDHDWGLGDGHILVTPLQGAQNALYHSIPALRRYQRRLHNLTLAWLLKAAKITP